VLTVSNNKYGLKKVIKRSKTFMKRSGTVMERSGTMDPERSGTPKNVRVGTQQRFVTNSGKRSRSRFKNERNTVN